MLKRGVLLAKDPNNLTFPADNTEDLANLARPSGNPTTDTDLATHGHNPAERVFTDGANITSNSNLLTDEETLTKAELEALERENAASLKSLTKDMKVILGVCAIGAIV